MGDSRDCVWIRSGYNVLNSEHLDALEDLFLVVSGHYAELS